MFSLLDETKKGIPVATMDALGLGADVPKSKKAAKKVSSGMRHDKDGFLRGYVVTHQTVAMLDPDRVTHTHTHTHTWTQLRSHSILLRLRMSITDLPKKSIYLCVCACGLCLSNPGVYLCV